LEQLSLRQAMLTFSDHPLSFHSLPSPRLLLQQSLNMLQGETKPIRRVIEGRFDEIKAITESGRPNMTPEMCTW
jgi:hypothetical protein